jgi:hypothetical protein
MRLPSIISNLLLSLSICIGADESELRHRLEIASKTNGLALVASTGDHILVIPFDGSERHFQAEHRFSIVTIGKSGQIVSWWFRKPDFFDIYGEFVVTSMNGDVLAKGTPRMAGFRPIALSDAGKRVAFWVGHGAAGAARSLYWSPLDLSNAGFVDNDTGEPDWSTDGHALVYAKEGKVYVFDLSTGKPRFLVDGRDPTWSPNGKLIAFVAPDGHASLVTTDGVPETWSMSQHHPISPMRWSPEGDLVCFTEKLPTVFPLLDAFARVVVGRVTDGATITTRNLGSESVSARAYYWISDYRQFCTRCVREGSPK